LLGAAANPDKIRGIVLVASGTVHLPCYSTRYRWRVRSLVLLSRITAAVAGHFPGKRLGFAGREASGVMRDWSHVAHTGEFSPHGSAFNYEQAMRKLKLPVLALNFKADPWSPIKATKGLLSKLPRSSPVHWHWGTAETEGLEFDHFSWTKQPALIATAVAQHICQTTAPPTQV
jgi:predicted alpha/beta hydrolase